jgi:thiamine biosynthesis lipoprotein
MVCTDAAGLPRFAGTAPVADQPRAAFVRQIMGLPISLHVRGPRARSVRVAQEAEHLFAELKAADALFSTWKPNSQVSRIRRGDLRLEHADPRVQRAAALCEEATSRTGGAFTAWLPDEHGEIRFDPTGLVKGWVVGEAFQALGERLADHDALISAGGDVAVACARVDTPDWQIAIEDPRDRTRTLLTIPLRTGAVATSGTAARGNHIIDPRVGSPARDLLSATVVGPELVWADVYATAAFVLGRQAGPFIETIADHAAVLVSADGKVCLPRG